MFDLQNLYGQEKVFLAGCIKSMVFSDGKVEDAEADDLDRVVDGYGFSDYESSLQEFENEADRQVDFWEMARRIDRPEARDAILSVLNELSLESGYPDPEQSHLLHELETIWSDSFGTE